MSNILGIFDFDHTIIDLNSDVVLLQLLPKEVIANENLKKLRSSWTKYMAEVFRLLPLHGVMKEDILHCCQQLKPTPGMLDLFLYLKKINADIFIASDSNSIIIDTWFRNVLPDTPVEVKTNPAFWNDEAILQVAPYENNIDCSMCPSQLCKGKIIKDLLQKTKNEKLIFYVGDGRNDYCPASKLRSSDLVFARRGFTLERLVSETPIKAKVIVWSNALEIKNELMNS